MLQQIISTLLQSKGYQDLDKKVVVITGASSGLGEALAHAFYAKGCRVVLCARRVDELQRVKLELLRTYKTEQTYPPVILPLDLAEINSLPACIQKVHSMYEYIDILINNGGISFRGNIVDTKVDVDIKMMIVNYLGPIALTKAALPNMIERKLGHVVFVSSVQGRIAIPHRSAYAAAKHALQAFADSLRAEVNEHNIEVTVISPGYIQTALSLNALTATGGNYGEMDVTTATGYSASYVAEKILNAVMYKKKELLVCPIVAKMAIFLRYFCPYIYFWIMSQRAQKAVKS